MIKAIIQAIPFYVMSYFLLPTNLCKKIKSLISRLWEDQKEEEHRIHWANWERLCKPKKVRRFGFRDFHYFNLAMLVKQGWKILNDEFSLLYQILKVRYFKSVPFF